MIRYKDTEYTKISVLLLHATIPGHKSHYPRIGLTGSDRVESDKLHPRPTLLH